MKPPLSLRARAVLILTAAAVAAASAAPAATGRSFIWKASRQQGVIYLVGSVHMLTADYYPLSPALESAFKVSDLLVEEADLGQMLSPATQLTMLSRGMLPPGQTLQNVLSPAAFTTVTARVSDLGLPPEMLTRFKPWLLAVTMLALEWQRAGFDADLGLDKHFYDRALREGKAVQGLETVEYQISRFDEMTMPQQERLLLESLKDLDSEKANVAKLADAWKNGDAAAIERMVLEDVRDDPLLYKRLLVERNQNWLPQIEALFSRPGRSFVVVGAAHLVGPDGLLAMLRAKGYTLEQQ
jgi:hypothetical protein